MSSKILCAHCQKPLYRYLGTYEGKISWQQFSPLSEDVEYPRATEKMVCPKCFRPWYLLRSNGSIVVLTDQGLRPREPVGEPRSSRVSGGSVVRPIWPTDLHSEV